MSKINTLYQFGSFLKTRKKLWLLPIVVILLLVSSLIVLAQGSAAAPFIYTLF
jgi:hypothetical protein